MCCAKRRWSTLSNYMARQKSQTEHPEMAFYVLVPQKLHLETASGMSTRSSVFLYQVSFVPLLFLKEWSKGKRGITTTERGTGGTELWTGHLLNCRLVSTIHHVVLHLWLTTAEREWFPGLCSAKLSLCQYIMTVQCTHVHMPVPIGIMGWAKARSSHTLFPLSFPWTWV